MQATANAPKKIVVITMLLTAVGAVTALLSYLDAKRERALKAQLMNMEKEMKLLQIEQLKGQRYANN